MEICQSQTGLQGVALYSSPKRVTRKGAANYQPIACLNTMYKAVTAYIVSELLTYTYANDLLPMAKRAIRKGRWGCVDCLLLDQTIGLDAKIMGKPLSVAWIDYEKAYDSLSQVGDEGAKNHQVPRLDPEVYRALRQTLGYCA